MRFRSESGEDHEREVVRRGKGCRHEERRGNEHFDHSRSPNVPEHTAANRILTSRVAWPRGRKVAIIPVRIETRIWPWRRAKKHAESSSLSAAKAITATSRRRTATTPRTAFN